MRIAIYSFLLPSVSFHTLISHRRPTELEFPPLCPLSNLPTLSPLSLYSLRFSSLLNAIISQLFEGEEGRTGGYSMSNLRCYSDRVIRDKEIVSGC